MNQKTIDEYQGWLKETSWYGHAGEHNAKEMAYLMLGLSGETGELADAFKKIVREVGFDSKEGFEALMKEQKLELIDELGDVMWYMAQICNYFGVNLTTLMAFNAAKLHRRLADNYKYQDTPWPFSDPMLSLENVDNARSLTKRYG